MIRSLLFFIGVAVLVCTQENEENDPVPSGIAYLNGKYKHSVVEGQITFAMMAANETLITGKITGMPPGEYGLNIHEKGDIGDSCSNILGHFNPYGHEHGHPDDKDRHVGALGNVEFDDDGVALVFITDHQVKLFGTEGVIGRAVALSSMIDDYGKTDDPSSKINGNAGSIVACGVIGIK